MEYMSRYRSIALLTLGALVLPSCGWTAKEDPMVEELCSKDVFLVNVLDKKFADDFSIAGSKNIPFDELMKMTDKDFAKRTWNKDVSRIIVYCGNYSCGASGAAAEFLKEQGFKNVYAYEGGSAEWLHKSKEDPHYKYTGAAQEGYLQDWENKAEHDEATRGEHGIDRGYPVISAQQLRQIIDECIVKS